MKVIHVRAMEGPNVYIRKPVLVLRLDLEEYAEKESYEFPGLAERLLGWCPGLRDHHCALGRPGGFVERLYGGTYLGHVIEHVALELQTLAGYTTNFGKTRSAGRSGLYDIVVEYQSERPARHLLSAAVDLVAAAARGERFELEECMEKARRIQAEYDLGPSTSALVEAARSRGIPVRRIGPGSLVQLGTGCHRKLLQATMTQDTSAVAVDIAGDKALAKDVLSAAGIRVPDGYVARSFLEARGARERIGKAVAVKPLNGCQGQAVTLCVEDDASLEKAFSRARRFSGAVVVEEHIVGRQYRVLVAGGRVQAVSERVPAHVVGNGRDSVARLIETVNADPERGTGHEKPLTKIAVDEIALQFLQRGGRSPETVPAAGEVVFLRDSANLSTGGIAVDATDDIHPSIAEMAVRSARLVGLDICGVDLVAKDIRAPADQAGAAVIEVNAAPGIRMHLYPSAGRPRNVAAPIVESLFPVGSRSRVPLVSVTGTNGKTTVVRMIHHVLRHAGFSAGMTSTDGVYIGGRQVAAGDMAGPSGARMVLSDPAVEAAVLETARGGILRGGLGYDRADVGIITNITMDHLGQDGLETLEDVAWVKSLVAECVDGQTGIAVLNADDPESVRLSARIRQRMVFVSAVPDNPAVKAHLARGGMAFFARDGWLFEAAGSFEWRLAKVDELPVTLSGLAEFHISNALMAFAAARHLGVSRRQAAEALSGFRSDTHNPGRVNLFRLPSGQCVIADYGHNPESLRALGKLSLRLAGEPIPAVIGFPGDRRDEVVKAAAAVAAGYFSPCYVKEDRDRRGRAPGEMAGIIAQEIRRVNPEGRVRIQRDECGALGEMLRDNPSAPYLVIFHESLAPVRDYLLALGAQEVGGAGGLPAAAISAM